MGLKVPLVPCCIAGVRQVGATTNHVFACCIFALIALGHGVSCALDEIRDDYFREQEQPFSHTLSQGRLSKRALGCVPEAEIEASESQAEVTPTVSLLEDSPISPITTPEKSTRTATPRPEASVQVWCRFTSISKTSAWCV